MCSFVLYTSPHSDISTLRQMSIAVLARMPKIFDTEMLEMHANPKHCAVGSPQKHSCGMSIFAVDKSLGMFFIAVVVPNPRKVADNCGCGHGRGSGGIRSGNRKSSSREPGKWKNPRGATCSLVGYTSRKVSNTVGKQSTPGYEDFILGRRYNSTSNGDSKSRSAQRNHLWNWWVCYCHCG